MSHEHVCTQGAERMLVQDAGRKTETRGGSRGGGPVELSLSLRRYRPRSAMVDEKAIADGVGLG